MEAPQETATQAGLRYVNDDGPGIKRRRTGGKMRYYTPQGGAISDKTLLNRIHALGIPPAWQDVWICPIANGHIQATGRDARGRKQYRYHTRWREVRDGTKYERMLRFGEALPQLRAQVDSDLSKQGLPREKVLATVVYLLENTLIRVGNATYARENNSFGLTTLQDDHVEIRGGTMVFEFRGKSNKDHSISLQDKRIAQIVKKCRELPGQSLFQYLDEHDQRATIDSGDVNEYLNAAMEDSFTAKDFRTWAGTVHALLALEEAGPFENITDARRKMQQAVTRVSQRLGNTPAICRSSYIHPAVLQLYLEGVLFDRLQAAAEEAERQGVPGLAPEEARVIPLLASAAAVTKPAEAKKHRRPKHSGNRRTAKRHRG